MTKKYHIATALFLSCSFALSLSANAQTTPIKKDTTRNAVTEEIEVVRSYKPVLADAVKIRRSPNLNDTQPFNPKVTYDLLDKRLELNSGIRELEAQKLALEKVAQLQNNFAKIGFGNLGTTFGQLNIATGQDQALQAGFNLTHLAMSGKLNAQKISKQEISGYGRSIGDHIILEGKLGYNRFGTYFYGQDPNGSFANASPEQQKFGTFEGEGILFNRVDADDETSFTYAAKIGASIFNNAFSAKENNFNLSGGIGKGLDKIKVGANGIVDFTSSKDLKYSFSNNLFKVNPYIQLNTDLLRFTAGVNYVNEFGSNQRIHFFPAASLDFMLIKNYLTLFGSFGGDINKNTIKGFASENPYLNEQIQLRNTVNKFNAAGGIRGTFAANIGFKAMVSYQTLEDYSYYLNNQVKNNQLGQPQKFDIAYFNGNMNVLGFDGELNINFTDAFTLDSKINLKQYNNSVEPYAWLHPTFTLSSNASFKIGDKIKLNGDVYFQGDTKAKILLISAINPNQPDYTVKSIKAFADISAGIEYQYNKKISGFFRVNNILGNEYYKYPYYPNYGINILGGLSYGF
ncbi:MAG: TonB-dependent receptor [Bacteroidetes bacterium]|nr:TonB-dependent receptor [Bacteroidota bacterium]MBU1374090.1 TonB-dependent receptor [Bacteroidota bacterium]MBU1484570.1 TonB-dependent receptor [Bacteroidota bacterium]MBU1760381.1 TonB-dependent receptor [Bacteroidota bacterium]MBU2267693.1 TonB-dependent receptor [Bacteroidota bacterium]